MEQEYEVQVRDGGSPSLSAVARLTLIIVDVNDCPPQFTQSVYVFDVVENCERATSVGTVSASDADSWPFNVVRLFRPVFRSHAQFVNPLKGQWCQLVCHPGLTDVFNF